ITRNQRARLCDAGVTTLRSLAALPPDSRIPRLQPETAARLQSQTALQLAKRDTGENGFEVLPPLLGKGFARLPRADPGDIFFDMEGYPFFDDGSSLEYLFGFVTADVGAPRFSTHWAHDRATEKQAFEDAIDFIT